MGKSISIMLRIGLGMISTVYGANIQGSDETENKYGYPMSATQSQLLLQKEIREAFVGPYLERIEIRNASNEPKTGSPITLEVWIIADDRKGYKVFYDYTTLKFGLAKYTQGGIPYTSEPLNLSNDLTTLFLPRK